MPSCRNLLLPLLSISFLSSPVLAAGATVVGSGRLQTEQRQVASFEAVALRGGVHATLRQGTREAVEVRADDNLLPLIETRVVDRDGLATLEIGPARDANLKTRNDISVNVDLIRLKALAIAGAGEATSDALKTPALKVSVGGSGDARLRQLATDDLAITVSGSGDVSTSGRAGRLAVTIAGSGDVDTRALESDEVSVSIAGSGDASVNARKTLAISIAGSGDVSYTGDAAVKTAIAGSGTVKRR
jgi:hypothetical protein